MSTVLFVCRQNADLEDPAGQPVGTVRTIRDEISTRLQHLLLELGA